MRLDAGTTKNGDARVFPFTTELRRVLEAQHKIAEALKRAQGQAMSNWRFCSNRSLALPGERQQADRP